MLRFLITAVVALGLHVGIGKAVYEVSKTMERPLRVRSHLLRKDVLEDVKRQIEELREERPGLDDPNYIEIALEEIEEVIETLDEGGPTELAVFEIPTIGGGTPEAEKEEAIPEPEPEVELPPAPPAAVVEAGDVLDAPDADYTIVDGGADSDAKAAEIASALAELDVNVVGALGGGVATEGILGSAEVPAGLLDTAGRPDGYRVRGGVVAKKGMAGSGTASIKNIGSTKAKRRRARVRGVSATGVAESDVKRLLKRSRTRFKRCYERGLERDPDLSGSVRIRLRIGPNGEVLNGSRSEQILAELSAPVVASCMLSIARSLAFAPPEDGGGTVTFTVRLTRR